MELDMGTHTKVYGKENGIIVFAIIYHQNGKCKNMTRTFLFYYFNTFYKSCIIKLILSCYSSSSSLLSSDSRYGFISHSLFIILSIRIISHGRDGIIIVDSTLDAWLVSMFFPFSLFSFSLLEFACSILILFFIYSSAIITTKTRERQRCWRERESEEQ